MIELPGLAQAPGIDAQERYIVELEFRQIGKDAKRQFSFIFLEEKPSTVEIECRAVGILCALSEVCAVE